MSDYCLVGAGLLAEHTTLFEMGREAFAALDTAAEALDAHLAECETCRRAEGLEQWAAEYDNAERDFVQDNVEY